MLKDGKCFWDRTEDKEARRYVRGKGETCSAEIFLGRQRQDMLNVSMLREASLRYDKSEKSGIPKGKMEGGLQQSQASEFTKVINIKYSTL